MSDAVLTPRRSEDTIAADKGAKESWRTRSLGVVRIAFGVVWAVDAFLT